MTQILAPPIRSSSLANLATLKVSRAVMALAVVAALLGAWVFAPDPIIHLLFGMLNNSQSTADAHRVINLLDHGDESFSNAALTPDDVPRLRGLTAIDSFLDITFRDASGKAFWLSENRHGYEPSAPSTLVLQVLQSGQQGFGLVDSHQHTDNAGLETGSGAIAERVLRVKVEPVLADGNTVGAIELVDDVTSIHHGWVRIVHWIFGIVGGVIGTISLVAVLRIHRSAALQLSSSRAHSQAENDFLSEQLRLGREVRLLGDLNEWLQSSKSLEELFYMVTRFMSHLLPGISGSIYVYSNSRDVLDGACSWHGGGHKAHIHPEDCWGLRRGRTYSYSDSDVKFVCGLVHDDVPQNYICIPFLAHGETVGMMHLSAGDAMAAEAFTTQRKLAQMCAEQISLAIANVRMRDELHYQAIRDALTGLYNRRHMMDTLRRRIETRKGAPFSIVSIDVDHFKNFNDTHGHDAGDVVLRSVGEVLTAACDGNDIACRMGGEELMLMLPDIDHTTALDRAEAVRKAVSDLKVRYGDKTLPQITVSIGVADYPGHGALPQDVIRAADEALYAAKANGRNCVASASDVQPGSFMPPLRHEDGAIAALAAE